jgi:tetratricopeptide (TPR) repeat protein
VALQDVGDVRRVIRLWNTTESANRRRTPGSLDKREKALWRVVCRAWNARPACTAEIARRYARLFPKDARGWVILANGLGDLGRFAEAKHALRAAWRLERRERTDLAMNWGRLYLKHHNLRLAERWFRDSIDREPSTSNHLLLGSVLAEQGHFGRARALFRKAVHLGTDASRDAVDEVFLNLGLLNRAQQGYREAARWLTKALRLDPKYVAARRALRDVNAAKRLAN